MDYHIEDFSPVEGEPTQFRHESGAVFVTREGQSLSELLIEIAEDAKRPPEPASPLPEPSVPSVDFTPLIEAMAAEGAISLTRRDRILARLQG